jgi:hypothetical protein
MVLKAILVTLLISNVINAEGNKQFGLTGGTKGVGIKYIYPAKYFELDMGFPFYYAYDKRTGDTVEWNHNILVNFYIGISARIIKYYKNEICVGMVEEPTVGYEYKYANDSSKEKRMFITKQYLGPLLQYVRKNSENERIFSFELFPFIFFPGEKYKENFSFSPNVQICAYIK